MRRQTLAFVSCLVTLGAGALLAPLGAQAPAGTPRPDGSATPPKAAWTMPRTPDGTPDVQGNWSNATVTPLERPAGQPALLSKEIVAKIEKGVQDRIDALAQPSDPNRQAPPQGGDGSTGAAGNVGGYNNFWIDAGERVAVVNGEYRTSLIVDPPDGRVPALTDAARARQAERARRNAQFGEYDNPENRPLAERCIASFGSNAGPPMLPNYFYNNNYTIVQTPDHVMIMTEMVHDARIIRIGRQHTHPPSSVRPWWGDSIGWWEGDTLLYRFTIDDPQTFTRPWSGEVPFEKLDELIYEYACHEGNYALSNVLSGERSQEKAREAAKKTPPPPRR